MTPQEREFSFDFDVYVADLDGGHAPALGFRGGRSFASWRRELASRIRGLLGPPPPPVPLDAVTVAARSFPGYVRHKVVYRTMPGVDAPAYLLIPDGVDAANPAPAVLALHGHGGGKRDLVTRSDHPGIYDAFGRRCAERGFVVLAPDAVGFGERAAGFGRYGGRDGCNVNQLKLALFGGSLMALTVRDDGRAVDYLASRPEVDPTRIACAGLSFGGTRAMYLAALDERLRAAVVSGYLSTFRAYALEQGNFCGSQFLPGVYALADLADIHGLIAPRPLLIQAGRADRGFPIESARAAFAHLRRIYAAAGALGHLELDEFDGGHELGSAAALEFLERVLSAAGRA